MAKPAISGVGLSNALKGRDCRYFEQFTKNFESQHESFTHDLLDGRELWKISTQEHAVWLKKKNQGPGQVAQLVGASSHTPKGFGFDTW